MAAFIVLGAVAGFAQDPCADAEGQTTLGDKFRAQFSDKSIDGRKAAIETGKQFMEKFGSCESAKELADYLKLQMPKMEEGLKKAIEAKEKADLIAKFNKGLETKNWDDVYAAGKGLLTKWPDEFRDVELALGSIGYDESFKNIFKFNEDTLKYARMSISELEAGKTFSANYGVPKDFVYKSKENALGWMNMIVGYITNVAQKNKAASLPYLFKAAQSTSVTPDTTAKNPIPYELIGNYYFEELDKLTNQITEMAKNQPPATAPEAEIKAAVDAIKAKVALSNGMAERAMDAFSRAYSFAKTTPDAKSYKDKMKKNVEAAYNLRFAKTDGVDAWIAASVKKPLVDPTTPVTPISDPEPATAPAAGTTTTTPPATPAKPGTTTPAKPGPPTTKPPVTPAKPPAMPMEKPAVMAKPQAKVKKSVTKKKTT